MADLIWSDEGKTERERIKRRSIVRNMGGLERGWSFVEFINFTDMGHCQVTGAPMKGGVKVRNGDLEFIIAENVAIKYVSDVVIPRQTQSNTVTTEPTSKPSIIPEPKEPKKRGRPKLTEEQKQAVRDHIGVEPGLPAEFLPNINLFSSL
jgi:hypothetical protein